MDMSNYKMIYKNKIYNCLQLFIRIATKEKIEEVEVIYLNEENRLTNVVDKVEEFQFVSK